MAIGLTAKIIGGTIVTLIAGFFALRKFVKFLFPLKVTPGYYVNLDNSKPDAIKANITNRSTETVYITDCIARGTYSIKHIVLVHLKNPLIKPRLYPNVWYHGATYTFLDDESLKIEPGQPIQLEHKLSEHWLSAMHTPYFRIKVKTSSGKTVRSKKIKAPIRWSDIGKKHV